MESLRKYIKIAHECGFEDSEHRCFSEEQEDVSGMLTDIQDNGYKFILLNGVSVNIDFVLDTYQEGANARWIYFDINGPQPPNVYEQDVFVFMLEEPGDYGTQTQGAGVVPYGNTRRVLETGKIIK